VGRVICASPRYIDQFGEPKSRADLTQHRCIAFTAPGRGRWPFRTADRSVEYLEVAGIFASDNQECILQLEHSPISRNRIGDSQGGANHDSR
jgi:hypothetical protein